jgi:hypothetical protein
MFFHIPLAEAYEDGDRAHRSNAVEVDTYPHGILELGGQNEGAGNAKHSSNIFSQGIQKAFELEHGESEVAEVKVLSHGHCHLTDRCRRVSGVWMCFDGGSSFSGYGSKDFERRVRIYIVSDWGETITSYKRLVSGNLVDKQVLVGKGAPAGWGRR